MTFKTLALASTMLTRLAGLAAAEELRFYDVFIIGDSLSDAGVYSQSVIAARMARTIGPVTANTASWKVMARE